MKFCKGERFAHRKPGRRSQKKIKREGTIHGSCEAKRRKCEKPRAKTRGESTDENEKKKELHQRIKIMSKSEKSRGKIFMGPEIAMAEH